MRNFARRVVVVTGAGSGMGRAYAIEFARLGARLALNDYQPQRLAESARLARAAGAAEVYCEAFDVSARDAVYHFAEQVRAHLGNAEVLINNAGVAGAGLPAWDIPEQALARTLDINFWGVVHCTRAFLPQLRQQPEAALVNVSSIFGLIGTPEAADYCASKFAVRGFSEALMVELSESSVQVHLVHPGGIDTDIARGENVADPDRAARFAREYLTTPPEALVRRVIRGIERRQPRIVYGRDSYRAWLASILLPLGWRVRILWREYVRKGLLDLSRYRKKDGAEGRT